jgi:hypothetical protein
VGACLFSEGREEWQIKPYCQPAKEVGGDFYEFYQLDDGRVGFAVSWNAPLPGSRVNKAKKRRGVGIKAGSHARYQRLEL